MEVEGEGGGPWRAIMASAGRMAVGVREQAVKLLNEAKMQPDAPSKADLLKNVMEIVLHREPSLLPEFVPYLMELQSEPGSPVRKYLAEYVICISFFLCFFAFFVSGCYERWHDLCIVLSEGSFEFGSSNCVPLPLCAQFRFVASCAVPCVFCIRFKIVSLPHTDRLGFSF